MIKEVSPFDLVWLCEGSIKLDLDRDSKIANQTLIESINNNMAMALPPELDSASDDDDYSARKEHRFNINPDTKRTSKPESILRNKNSNKKNKNTSTSMHWPKLCSVNFPPEPRMITSVHSRPRTPICDLSSLYYSPDEIEQFKLEYQQHMVIVMERNVWRQNNSSEQKKMR
eukprot:859292_1